MKITLNKANKIRSLLEAFVNGNAGGVISNTISVQASRPIKFVQEQIEAAKKEALKKNESYIPAIDNLFLLRKLIAEANVENSVNTLINEIARLNWQISKFRPILERNESSLDDFAHMQTVFAAKGEVPVGNVSIRIFSKEEIQNYSEIQEDLKKELRDVEELRNNLNHKSLLELPEELEKFLRDNKLL